MDREPQVDLTFVEIGLALAAIGFLLVDRESLDMRVVGVLMFITAAPATVFLYFVHIFDWWDKYMPPSWREASPKILLLWGAKFGIGFALFAAAVGLIFFSGQFL